VLSQTLKRTHHNGGHPGSGAQLKRYLQISVRIKVVYVRMVSAVKSAVIREGAGERETDCIIRPPVIDRISPPVRKREAELNLFTGNSGQGRICRRGEVYVMIDRLVGKPGSRRRGCRCGYLRSAAPVPYRKGAPGCSGRVGDNGIGTQGSIDGINRKLQGNSR
jgi:hypothetical protein